MPTNDDDDRPREPSPPQPVSQGIFTYDGEEIYAHGREIDDPSSWRPKIFPEEAAGDDAAAADLLLGRRCPFSRDYMLAQFAHYGIPHDSSATQDDLFRCTREAFRSGKFDAVPASVTAMHDMMRQRWQVRQQAYLAELEIHEAQLAQWKDAKFRSKATLSEKAAFDLHLFVETYYLDSSGRPDRTKMPSLLTLENYRMCAAGASATIMELVPGLFATSHYAQQVSMHHSLVPTQGLLGTLWIGWDADEIGRAKAGHVAKTEEEDRLEAQRAERERTNDHHRYLARRDTGSSLWPSIFGRYLVRCPALEDWGAWNARRGLYLTIRPAAITDPVMDVAPYGAFFEAVMEFGVVSGKILLTADKGLLDEYLKPYVDDYDVDDEDVEGGGEGKKSVSGVGKEGENTTHWRARDGGRWVPLIYHFIWEGHEVDGGRTIDYRDGLRGRILFSDASFASFGGEIDLVVEGRSFFGGGKVSDSTECDDSFEGEDEDDDEDDDYAMGGFGGYDDDPFDHDEDMYEDLDEELWENALFGNH